MARDFIPIDRSNTSVAIYAPLMIDLVRAVRMAYEQAKRVKDIMTHNNDGADFSDIEKYFGLPVGKGNAVFDLVNGTVGSMEGTFQVDDAKELSERVG